MQNLSFEFNFNSISSIIAIVLSAIGLVIHFRNRKTTAKSYLISKVSYLRNSFDLMHIESKQGENEHLVKLAVYNPGSIQLLIRCVKIYKQSKIANPIYNFFGFHAKWERINDARWWPSKIEDFSDEKYLHQEYENLMVKDIRNIFVKIPGYMDRSRHKFEIMTSFGSMIHITTITGTNSSFSSDYTLIPSNKW